MSSAIKPPGSGGPVGGAGAPPESGGARPVEGASEEFRAALENAGEADASKAAGASASAGGAAPAEGSRAALLRSLAEDLRAGRIDPQQAVDRLVDRTLSSGAAASLPPARRAELEALLRSTLDEDPTLAAMQRDLSRGR